MYAKVFASLWDGSMVGKTDVQLVFIFLLAKATARGEVNITPQVIGYLTGMGTERAVAALAELEGVDWDSRTPDDDGRRIERLDEHRAWGWRIKNYLAYRSIRDEGERSQQNREAQARFKGKPRSAEVSQGKPDEPKSAQAEAEAEGESQKLLFNSVERPRAVVVQNPAKKAETEEERNWRESFPLFWEDYPRKQKRLDAEKAWASVPHKSQDGFDRVIAGLDRWKASRQWQDTNYVPLAATWLRAAQYDDVIPEVGHGIR